MNALLFFAASVCWGEGKRGKDGGLTAARVIQRISRPLRAKVRGEGTEDRDQLLEVIIINFFGS